MSQLRNEWDTNGTTIPRITWDTVIPMWSGVKSHQFCLHTPVPCSLSPGPFTIATSDLTSVTSACPTALSPLILETVIICFWRTTSPSLQSWGNCQSRYFTFGKGVNMRSKPSQDFNIEWNDTGIEDSWTESFQSKHPWETDEFGGSTWGRTWFSSKLRTKRQTVTEVGQREIRISACYWQSCWEPTFRSDWHVGFTNTEPPKITSSTQSQAVLEYHSPFYEGQTLRNLELWGRGTKPRLLWAGRSERRKSWVESIYSPKLTNQDNSLLLLPLSGEDRGVK